MRLIRTYRLVWPAQVVKKVRPDWDVELYDPGMVKTATDERGNLTKLAGIEKPGEIDLLVLQRIGIPASLRFMEWAQRQGIAVVVDSDDAMWCIDEDNIAHRAWTGGAFHFKYLDQACEIADLSTVTTERLSRRYGRHGRVEVIPNAIPEASRNLKSLRDEHDPTVTIGWAGFTATHPHDLKVCGDAVAQAVVDTGCKVRVIGDAEGAERDWKLPKGTVEQFGPFSLGVNYYTGLTAMDIGLVPLRDSHFNHSKSWLKALEFSAMGVPVIASPNEDNRRLAKDVPILLANSPSEWYDLIVRLVTNPEERAERGRTARESVLEHHTVESQGEMWARAWERALNRRAKLS